MEFTGKINHALTDEEIVLQIKLGEINLFEKIISRYNQRLYRTARAYGITDADCDDLLQQSYIMAYEKLEQFRGDAKFSTWLTKILINNCLMHKRKQTPLQDEMTSYLENIISSKDKNDAPEKKLMQKELKDLLEGAIENLPEEFKTVYIMREVEDLNVKETADCLALTEANVKVRLHRAKILLRKTLEASIKKDDIFEFGNKRCAALTEKVMQKLTVKH